MHGSFVLASAALLCPLLSPGTDAPDAPDDAALLAAWEAADADLRREVVDYLDLDLSHQRTFQLDLSRWVVSAMGVDPGLLDEAREPRWFDPQVHAPKQPIPRQLLEPDDPRAVRVQRAMRAGLDVRAIEPAYVYDWGQRAVVIAGDTDDPTRRFRAALAGLPREFDLVEAQVLAWLDDGSKATVLEAFGNLYSDRDGRVYPGITLYEAWSSGTSIEMPDVDTLGLVHSIDDEWDRWVAPVPERQHEALYGRIGSHFVPARHHRGLREALALTYLTAEPAYRDGYTEGNTVGFHALWNRRSSDPRQLVEDLPAAQDWAEFLERVNADLADTREFYSGGTVRRDALAADQATLRRRLVAIMRELEVLPTEDDH
ncbi:hypothetical protein Pla163_21520 [Planctomycetes bacterium Pla163]|uniref:Uncharacterized protein n=2 Tax=Rohdeia mirabilis TaxID=2528008 RepID=A0A518D0L0_9BACT|nr:hypothetical protein Pla163_21520 [Planctomycetes bacterium Pla163]